jgi:hypothetical protein
MLTTASRSPRSLCRREVLRQTLDLALNLGASFHCHNWDAAIPAAHPIARSRLFLDECAAHDNLIDRSLSEFRLKDTHDTLRYGRDRKSGLPRHRPLDAPVAMVVMFPPRKAL